MEAKANHLAPSHSGVSSRGLENAEMGGKPPADLGNGRSSVARHTGLAAAASTSARGQQLANTFAPFLARTTAASSSTATSTATHLGGETDLGDQAADLG